MKLVEWAGSSAKSKLKTLQRPAVGNNARVKKIVRGVLAEVLKNGDAAVKNYTKLFDKVVLGSLEVSQDEKRQAIKSVSKQSLTALKRAADQIEKFHLAQVSEGIDVQVSPGLRCQRLSRPIESVGLYIPGGTAPLPSTVLMLGIPAKLANCPTRVLATPPNRSGKIDPVILAAAKLCAIPRVFKMGGAQAIAALAYGTESVPKVDKIFGPGNSYVTEAKQQISSGPGGVAYDLPAGPSEVMVIADRAANAEFVAADLLSQAEHGLDSQVVLVSDSEALIKRTLKAVQDQVALLPRRVIAEGALGNSVAILVGSIDEALDVANLYAPEHLILQVKDAASWTPKIKNAGSVFLGAWSPESLGDYASGTNHVLPTYGQARACSGVSVDSFLKHITFQEASKAGLKDIGPTVQRLAMLEGLVGHERAVSIRLRSLEAKGGRS